MCLSSSYNTILLIYLSYMAIYHFYIHCLIITSINHTSN
eukprot:UN07456